MPNTPHFHFASVGSTLTKAWAMVEDGEATSFWVTADEQTQGRGRMDRTWVSAPGNLYSTYLAPSPPVATLSLLPFAVSLAVSQAIGDHLPAGTAVALKWPNDVLIDGAKTSGILIEQKTRSAHPPLMAVGIGLNVEHAPTDLGRATTCMADHGSSASAGAVFASLRQSLAQCLQQLTQSPSTIIPTWSQRASGIGGPITVRNGDDVLEGTFDHLASDGALMVRLSSGAMRTIRTGDIVIRPR